MEVLIVSLSLVPSDTWEAEFRNIADDILSHCAAA